MPRKKESRAPHVKRRGSAPPSKGRNWEEDLEEGRKGNQLPAMKVKHKSHEGKRGGRSL